MKKLYTLLLAISMSFLLSITAAASGFSDMDGAAYCAEAAAVLSDAGILSGYADGSFRADKPITRAEMAAVICRMTGMDDNAEQAKGKTDFSDVAASSWASGYINLAKNKGIISGSETGLFRPGDNVKLEEAVKMIICALGLGDEVETVPGDWSAGYFAVAKDLRITDGLRGAKGSDAMRGDVALMAYNALYGGGMIERDGFQIDSWIDEGQIGIDYQTVYGSGYSYCISADNRNAANLTKTFPVQPNTYYTASAYIKTENLASVENGDLGASISYNGWTISPTLTGDNDWTKITLLTYSGDKTELPVTFNYGFYQNTCTGKVYFSQIEFEKFTPPDSAQWNMLFVILPNSEIQMKDSSGKESIGRDGISEQEIRDIQESIALFKADSYKDSGGRLNVNTETIIIDKPITRLIDTASGPTLGVADAYELIKDAVSIDDYDHITFFGNLNLEIKPEKPPYYGLSFTDPPFPQNTGYAVVNTQMSKFSKDVAWRPALIMHEFLHAIEGQCRVLNQGLPHELDKMENVINVNDRYSRTDEWRRYYIDLMNHNLTLQTGEKIGIPDSIWKITPKDFRFTRVSFHG